MMWLPTLAMAFGVWTGIKYNINIQNYKKEQKMKKLINKWQLII